MIKKLLQIILLSAGVAFVSSGVTGNVVLFNYIGGGLLGVFVMTIKD